MRNAVLSSAVALLLSLPLNVSAATLYVDVNNLAPAAPYTAWTNAATSIQDAVDVASAGDEIVVTNGVYQTGGRVVSGAITNRVAVTNAITVRSVNGPAETIIQGYQVPGTTNGDSAIRCIYLADGAAIVGFTLTNGATAASTSSNHADASGGGAWCQSTNACLSNCVLVANSCGWWGAGAYSGTLLVCEVDGNINLNRSLGGGSGAAYGQLVGCTLSGNRGGGGGAMSCYLTNCVVRGNYNGGAGGCTLERCLVTGNNGTGVGGGVANNCTISSNTTPYTGVATYGGGASGATLSNCVLYANCATNGAGAYNCSVSFCTLSNNLATRSGGGIYLDMSSVTNTINDCTFAANAAGDTGGAVFVASSGRLAVLRCTFLNNAATINGGGLANAFALTGVGGCVFSNNLAGSKGGGIYWSTGTTTPPTNCTFYDNRAGESGGGTYSVSLGHCSFTRNQAANGGGAYGGSLTGCILTSNSATLAGGGSYSGTLTSCLLTENQAGNGGGAYGGSVYNCTLVSNSATNSGGGLGFAIAYNSIVYYNSAPTSSNYYSSSLNACCAVPLAGGAGNISNAPVFVDMPGGNFRLQANSPCINAGNNSYAAGLDLDGNPRIVGGTVDIGAYECQSPALLDYYLWLQGYGLSTAASAIYADSDGDGMNNWQEWICGTNPTNALSVLVMLAASNSVSGVTVSWQGVTNRTYFLQRSTNLLAQPAFTSIQSNIVGQAGLTSFTDPNATGAGLFFYRVGVQ